MHYWLTLLLIGWVAGLPAQSGSVASAPNGPLPPVLLSDHLPAAQGAVSTPDGGDVNLPQRRSRHQLRVAAGFSNNTGPNFESISTLGIGADYHYLHRLGPWTAGAGGGLERTSPDRGERLASLTGIVEYQLGERRLRPLLRVSGGLGLPVGSDGLRIHSRSPGPVFHPALGIILYPPTGAWGAIVADIGYRFFTVNYATTDVAGRSVDREVNYRRFTLGIATRF